MRLVTRFVIVGAIALAGAGSTTVKAGGGPAGYCPPIPLHNAWAPPGTCIDMPWGSLRCVAATPQGNWMGYPVYGCRR
jgi:hypothetical protein